MMTDATNTYEISSLERRASRSPSPPSSNTPTFYYFNAEAPKHTPISAIVQSFDDAGENRTVVAEGTPITCWEEFITELDAKAMAIPSEKFDNVIVRELEPLPRTPTLALEHDAEETLTKTRIG
jgi:hypothetical protein